MSYIKSFVNRSILKKHIFILFLLAFCAGPISAQRDTLRVVYYNLLKFPGSTSDRADSIRVTLDYLKPDILTVVELNSEVGADMVLNNSLNHSGRTNYARTPYLNGFDTDNLTYYNTNKLGFIRFDSVSTAGSTSTGSSRYIGYTRLYFKDPNLSTHRDTQYVDIFGMHLSASSDSTDSVSRKDQAVMLKNWMAARPHLKYILAGGDLNVYTSNEAGYQALLDSGYQTLKDPINRPGNWANNATFADIHTQSTRVRAFNGGSTGGLDDRFDFILTSDSLLNPSSSLKVIPGTYKAVGNSGLLFNDSLTHPPVSTLIPWDVLSALYYSSDHLPVYVELEVMHRIISLSADDEGLIQLAVSPNPTDGNIRINNLRKLGAEITLSLTDLQGRTLKSFHADGTTDILDLNFSEYPSGIYLLKANSGGRQEVRRLIKK